MVTLKFLPKSSFFVPLLLLVLIVGFHHWRVTVLFIHSQSPLITFSDVPAVQTQIRRSHCPFHKCLCVCFHRRFAHPLNSARVIILSNSGFKVTHKLLFRTSLYFSGSSLAKILSPYRYAFFFFRNF